jgi:hypothetical protein
VNKTKSWHTDKSGAFKSTKVADPQSVGIMFRKVRIIIEGSKELKVKVKGKVAPVLP